jgi:hypothetical protein
MTLYQLLKRQIRYDECKSLIGGKVAGSKVGLLRGICVTEVGKINKALLWMIDARTVFEP